MSSPRRQRFYRSPWTLYLALASPFLFVFVPILQNDIEYLADPAKYLLEYFGKTATLLFIVVMAVTPLRQLFGKSILVKALAYRRRELGVSVFAFALLHFLLYLPYVGSLEALMADWDKLFILSGLLALLLLLVLAATSNKASTRRLGGKRWKALHRLAYVVLVLVIYHQAAQEKTGYRETLAYFSPLLLLEGIRIARALQGKKASRRASA